MRVRFTPSGQRQFLAAIAYIHRDNPAATTKFRNRVEKSLRRLERFPNSGRKLPEFPEMPHREVTLPPYRFFYRVEKSTIWIVAVWHDAQLAEEPSE